MTGNITNCPKCGSRAAIGDGVYELEDDTIRLKAGPTLTRAMLAQLADIAQTAKTGAIKAEELLAEVADVSPELAGKLRERGLPALLIILFLIWLLRSVELSITVDLNRLIDQVQGVAAQGNDTRVLETPLPSEIEEPNQLTPPTVVAQSEAPISRQVRRQLERQSRKRNRDGRSSV